jgi:hypothetical protein
MDVLKTARDIGKDKADRVDLDEFCLGKHYMKKVFPTLNKLSEHGHIETGKVVNEFRKGVKEAKGIEVEDDNQTVTLTDKGLNFVRNVMGLDSD